MQIMQEILISEDLR